MSLAQESCQSNMPGSYQYTYYCYHCGIEEKLAPYLVPRVDSRLCKECKGSMKIVKKDNK